MIKWLAIGLDAQILAVWNKKAVPRRHIKLFGSIKINHI